MNSPVTSDLRLALVKCVAVLSGETMNKQALIDALEAGAAALRATEMQACICASDDGAVMPDGSVLHRATCAKRLVHETSGTRTVVAAGPCKHERVTGTGNTSGEMYASCNICGAVVYDNRPAENGEVSQT